MSEMFTKCNGFIVSGDPLVYADSATMTGQGTVSEPFGVKSTDLFVQEPLYTGTSGNSAYIGWRPDETVLWEGTDPLDQSCLVNGTRETATLSEPLSSFDRIRIYAVWNPWSGNFIGCSTFEYPGTNNKGGYIMNDCTNQGYIAGGSWSAIGTTFKLVKHWQAVYPAAKETSNGLGGIFKIVGINRISGGNE